MRKVQKKLASGSFSQEGVEQADDSVISDSNNAVMTKVSALNYNATSDGTGASTVRPRLLFNNITIGKSYRIRINPTNQSGTINFKLYDGSQYIITGNDLTTDIDLYFKVEGTSVFIAFDGTEVFNVDFEISLKEVGQNWTLETGWSIGEDKAISDGSGSIPNTDLVQSNVFTTGKSYKVTLEIKDYVSGNLQLQNNTTNFPQSNGVHTIYSSTGSTSLILRSLSFIGSITNISVKEVGQNWTFGDGFTPDEVNSKATCDGTQTAVTRLQQTITTNIQNQLVRVSFTLDYTAGLLLGSLAGTGAIDFNNIVSSGTYTAEMTSNEVNPTLTLQGDENFIGSITNVIIKSVTDETNLPRINYEGFSYQDVLGSEEITNGDFATDSDWIKQSSWTISNGTANYDGISSGNYLRQSWSPLTIGKTYRMTFDISDGSAYLQIRSGTSLLFEGLNIALYGTGSHVIEAKAISNLDNLRIYAYTSGGGTSFSIDNVSVKEVTGQEVVPDSGCGSWLFEPESRNLIAYSNNYADAYWIKSTSGSGIAPIVTSNYAISPDGTQNADRIQFDASTSGSSSDTSRFRTTLALVDGLDYTISFYAKSTDGTDQKIGVVFDNSLRSVFTITNEWQRFEVTRQQTGANSICGLDLRSNNASTSDILVYGIQVEQQSYSTSYIPTENNPNGVSRNQDVCTNGGSLASINSTEGVLYAEIAALSDDGTRRYISLNDGTSQNDVRLYFSFSGFIAVLSKVGGVTQVFLQSNAYAQTDFNKVAFKYKENDFALWVNGTKVDTDTSGLVNPPNTFNQLTFDGNGLKFLGKTKCLAVWKEALSDQELADLTYPTPTDPTFALNFDTIATDFTFARNSEATYVDAQGLIKSTNEIGEELVTNGDFATDSDWVKIGNVVIASGKATYTSGVATRITQNVSFVAQKKYLVTFDVVDYVSGNVVIGSNAGYLGTQRSANGTYSEVIEWSGNSTIYIYSVSNNFTGSIDNVSVKEYITETNTPRLDYSTGAEAFLLEPASRNLITYSEDLSDASWKKQNGGGTTFIPSVTANYGISPDGTQNASRVIFDLNGGTTSSDFSQLQNNITATVGNNYTSSVYMKSNDSNSYNVTFVDVNGSANIVSVTPQWQRFSISAVLSAANMRIRTRGSENSSDVTDVLIWGRTIRNLKRIRNF